MSGFSSDAIADWAKRHLAPGSQVPSDGLACFRAVTAANRQHEAIVTGGQNLNDLPQFRWIHTMLSNLKTSFSGTLHAFHFEKYARRSIGSYCYRFNRRFSLVEMIGRIAKAFSCCMPYTEWLLRSAELDC